jgi:hypothetical protein
MGTRSLLVESGRSVVLTPHPLQAPRSRMSRAIPLLLLLKPLVASYRVTFTFTFYKYMSTFIHQLSRAPVFAYYGRSEETNMRLPILGSHCLELFPLGYIILRMVQRKK